MGKTLFLLFCIFNGLKSSFAISIKDHSIYNYNVYFTNPTCKEYDYDRAIRAFNGRELVSKPKNVYCKYSDAQQNYQRENSPHFQLVKLFTDKDLEEIKMAYLSFSNSNIIETLCNETIYKNNVKVTLFVDKGNKSDIGKMKKINDLMKCRPAQSYIEKGIANYPRIEFRGQSSGIGYAHNKIIIANYKSDLEKRLIVFSSANMSSGTSLHHENWHFLTTSKESYFAQANECILEGMDKYSKSVRGSRNRGTKSLTGKQNFVEFIKQCRSHIRAEEEEDIKLFVVPGEGNQAMKNIVKNIELAKNISVAVHRFSHLDLVNSLVKAAQSHSKKVRLIADDDIFWAGKANELNGRIQCNPRLNRNAVPAVGANMCQEYFKVEKIKKAGVDVKYMQTNQKLFLLHHNKYIIFEYEDGTSALHCGAGNFTKAAFSKNFENYYFVKVPEIVEKFKKQYQYVWNELATSEEDLPRAQVLP